MKRALITGGTSPIGSAVSKELAAQGYHVIVHAHNNVAKAIDCVEHITSSGGSAEALALDLLDPDASDVLEQKATDSPIQVLVHCVGGQKDKPFAAMNIGDWNEIVDMNLTSFFAALRPIIVPMMRTRWGRIIGMSSLSGTLGHRGQANYAAAKGGLLPLVKTLTQEYGSRGITANVVSPGLIDTPGTRQLENFDALVRLSPANRAGTVEEVAALVSFLVSEKAGYISGQRIAMDGGTS